MEPREPGMLERILHPDRNSKSAYDGKMFDTGRKFSSGNVKTKDFAGVKSFASKEYATKEYGPGRQSWIGRLLFPEKKLPASLDGKNRDEGKAYPAREFGTKEYGDLAKRSGFGVTGDYPVRTIKPKGTTQGAIDNDQQLQEKIRQGLSVDDVRNLLNKAP